MTSFIVHPDYERRDFQKLHAYVQGLGLRMPAFTVLTPLPGTVLFEEVRDRILTTNYELFDLLHAVLPTHLPSVDFYREFAGLYRSTYPRWRVLAGVAYVVLRDLWRRNLSPAHWRALWAEGRKFTDPIHYLEDLAEALMEEEMVSGY